MPNTSAVFLWRDKFCELSCGTQIFTILRTVKPPLSLDKFSKHGLIQPHSENFQFQSAPTGRLNYSFKHVCCDAILRSVPTSVKSAVKVSPGSHPGGLTRGWVLCNSGGSTGGACPPSDPALVKSPGVGYTVSLYMYAWDYLQKKAFSRDSYSNELGGFREHPRRRASSTTFG